MLLEMADFPKQSNMDQNIEEGVSHPFQSSKQLGGFVPILSTPVFGLVTPLHSCGYPAEPLVPRVSCGEGTKGKYFRCGLQFLTFERNFKVVLQDRFATVFLLLPFVYCNWFPSSLE